jgi:hypothetical protein
MKSVRADTAKGRNGIVALEKKLTACDNFLSTTLSLKQALEKDQMKTAARLIKHRGGLIATIDGLDRRISGYPQPPFPDRASADIGTMKRISEEINEKLTKALAVNNECEALATGRHEELTNELAAINREAKGFRGYIPRGKQTPKFLNIRT